MALPLIHGLRGLRWDFMVHRRPIVNGGRVIDASGKASAYIGGGGGLSCLCMGRPVSLHFIAVSDVDVTDIWHLGHCLRGLRARRLTNTTIAR